MDRLLREFIDFRATRKDLRAEYGDDLLNAVPKVDIGLVTTADVVIALQKFIGKDITQDVLLDWVNTLMFCDTIFEYVDGQDDSISSVMTELETLDEDGVSYTDDDYDRMIAALEINTEFTT